MNMKDPEKRRLFCLDWDDTLLPSSFLERKGYFDFVYELPKSLRNELCQLEDTIIVLIELALQYGTVYIITNAESGWVEFSATKFVPRVIPLLSRVTVTSARSMYEDEHPKEPFQWKLLTFHYHLQAVLRTRSSKSIISFGDSHCERHACRQFTKGYFNCHAKSVKFVKNPCVEVLLRQLQVVINNMEYICNHEGDLDLMLSVKRIS